MEEVSNETCKNICERNTDLAEGIMNLLQTFCVMVKEVRVVIERKSFHTKLQEFGPSKDRPIEVLSPWKHKNIQVYPKALYLGMPEHNAMIKHIGHVSVDFSIIFLPHNVWHVAVDEMKEQEIAVFEYLKHSKNTISFLKTKAHEKKKKSQRWQQDRKILEQSITLACHDFLEEGVTTEMIP